jgi:carbonic anhydrase/acetyltransferase-like protein (isoleucine patch superfamily)
LKKPLASANTAVAFLADVPESLYFCGKEYEEMTLIKEVNGKQPRWGERCYVAENATLAGDIVMGDDCSVWFGAVLRADVDAIRLGNRVNVQDGACLHQTQGSPVVLEDDVSVGHGAVVHACTVRRGALIGMNAVVLDDAEIGRGAIVAAGAVVLSGTRVGPYEIWAGTPARFVKKASADAAITYAQHYQEIKEWYR